MFASVCRPSSGIRIAGIVASSIIAVTVLAGCTAGTSIETKPSDEVSAPEPSDALETPGDEAVQDDVFAERDAFFAEQGFTGGGPLQAKTDAQRALVQAQKDWTEQQGSVWDDRTESVLLALGSDTCETAILNGHQMDAFALKQLIMSSPLTAQLVPTDVTADQAAVYERNIASMSVFSASYLCPADNDVLQAAFAEAYPA